MIEPRPKKNESHTEEIIEIKNEVKKDFILVEHWLQIIFSIIGVLVVTGFLTLLYLNAPISNFPSPMFYTVVPGSNVTQVAVDLENRGIIKSSTLFKIFFAPAFNPLTAKS